MRPRVFQHRLREIDQYSMVDRMAIDDLRGRISIAGSKIEHALDLGSCIAITRCTTSNCRAASGIA